MNQKKGNSKMKSVKSFAGHPLTVDTLSLPQYCNVSGLEYPLSGKTSEEKELKRTGRSTSLEISRVSEGVDKINLAEDKIDKIDHPNEVSDEDKERSRVRKTLRKNSVKGKYHKQYNRLIQNSNFQFAESLPNSFKLEKTNYQAGDIR